VVAISAALIFKFFIFPQITDEVTFAAKAITFTIPMLDAVIIALVFIALRVSGGELKRHLLLFIIALLLLVAADFTFHFRNYAGLYWNGDIADLLYTLNMYVFSLAMIYTIKSATELEPAVPLADQAPIATDEPRPAVSL
jgi:hypothetical protein